jgi:hypothetical protein
MFLLIISIFGHGISFYFQVGLEVLGIFLPQSHEWLGLQVRTTTLTKCDDKL